MIVSKSALELFHISQDTITAQREELAAIRVERDSLKSQLATAKANFDWLAQRVNGLEIERAQLIRKAYGIDVPVPEIVRTAQQLPSNAVLKLDTSLFEDMGDQAAKEQGFPVYDPRLTN